MRRPWDLNRAIVILGCAITIGATAWFIALHPSHMMQAPVAVGAVLALVLVFWAPAWLYLVAGIVASAMPLLVFFAFGAIAAIEHLGSGIEYVLLAFVLLGALLALFGGVVGFWQARKRNAPLAGAGLSAPQGAFAGLLVALFIGLALGNGLVTKDYRTFADAPPHHIEGADEARVLVAGGLAFAPSPLRIPAGALVDVEVRNDDTVFHTLSYRLDDAVHTMVIPVGSAPHLWLKFDTPQTIHIWCDPHAGEDHAGGDMFGEIVVE